MVAHPLLVVAGYVAAGDGDVLVRVDGLVACALPVQLARQALHHHDHTPISRHQTKILFSLFLFFFFFFFFRIVFVVVKLVL
jgi:hypothetical protein